MSFHLYKHGKQTKVTYAIGRQDTDQVTSEGQQLEDLGGFGMILSLDMSANETRELSL